VSGSEWRPGVKGERKDLAIDIAGLEPFSVKQGISEESKR